MGPNCRVSAGKDFSPSAILEGIIASGFRKSSPNNDLVGEFFTGDSLARYGMYYVKVIIGEPCAR